MIKQAGILFAMTLMTSMAGFGGMLDAGQAVAPTKAAAVLFLILFFVALYRVLADVGPAQSADRQPRALHELREIRTGGEGPERPPEVRSIQA